MLAVSTRSIRTLKRTCVVFNQQHPAIRIHKQCNSSLTHTSFQLPGDVLKLPDGRTLGYHTSGPSHGIPILYIHGNPDSGIQITGSLETALAQKLGIQWIGPDRPGIGRSTMYYTNKGQEITHYPADIQSLVDHLGLKEYYILGTSGGTGYTLACAKDMSPKRLKGVGICAGIGPVECGFDSMSELIKTAWDMWRDHPKEMQDYIENTYVHLARDADSSALGARLEADLRSYLTGKDLEHVLRDGVFDAAVTGYRQIYAQGAVAHAKGIEVNLRPWGFRLEDVGFPKIRLWYGTEDVNTTPIMGRYMADRLPGAVYKEYKGKSHITIWDEETLEEMLRDLVEQAS
jgi:pimeloyl-ACP methyl ester carboxylesterase